jgi:hypothetical protein
MFSIARSTALRASRTQLRSSHGAVPHISALARLLSSLAVLEQRDGKLNVSSLAAVTAAQKLGGSVTAIVAGSGIKAVAEEAAKVKGLEKIIFIENGAYDKVCMLCSIPLELIQPSLINYYCTSTPNLCTNLSARAFPRTTHQWL